MKLKTEERNPKTTHIHRMSTQGMVELLGEEGMVAAKSAEAASPAIAAAIDAIFPRMQAGGRLFYVGCGTSGRLGVLDASEIPPSYGVRGKIIGVIAGGDKCLREASEGAEDSEEQGRADILSHHLQKEDSVVGISAAGGAMYVVGALAAAKEQGALTVALTSNEHTKIGGVADMEIFTNTGAEPITGSTRMKAGTAQKLVLNTLSTALMVKLGYVYENYMVHMRPTNRKLRARLISIVMDLTGRDETAAEAALEATDFQVKDAVKRLKGEE